MIVPNGQYYLYRHIRLDKNEPFYIGIGKKNKHQGMYNRAVSKKNRNNIWNGIESKTDISVEILLESDDKDFIEKKEKEFISLYGKIISNTGTLANIQDGGMYAANKINTIKEGHPEYYKRIERFKKLSKDRVGKNNFNSLSIPVFVYSDCGGLLFGFDSLVQCAEWLGKPFKSTIIKRKIDKDINHLGYFFRSYQKRNIEVKDFKIETEINNFLPKKIAKIDENGEIIKVYENAISAEKEHKLSKGTIQKALKITRSKYKKQFKYL